MATCQPTYDGLHNKLSEEDWKLIIFLMKKPIDIVKSELKDCLMEVNVITESLFRIKRYDLLTEYGLANSDEYRKKITYRNSCLDPARILILRLYQEMGDDDIDRLLNRMGFEGSKNDVEEANQTSLHKLNQLDEYYFNDSTTFADNLLHALAKMPRRDLLPEVQQFKDEVCDKPILVADHIFSRSQKVRESADANKTTATELDKYLINKKNKYFGHCLIINMYHVKGRDPRKGSDNDVARLEQVFKNLKYDVQTLTDYPLEVLKEKLEDIQKMDFSDRHVFVTFVMSHGKEGLFLTSDGEEMTFGELQEYYKPKVFKSLTGKPKIFFIQACQGTNKYETFTEDSKTALPSAEEACGDSVETDGSDCPDEVDFFIEISTVEKYFSQRNIVKGAWFIQTLCSVLDTKVAKEEVEKIVKHVRSQLILKKGDKGQKQISMTRKNTLHKECYLSMPDS